MKRGFAILSVLFAVASHAQFVSPPKQITDLNWMVGSWKGEAKMSPNGMEMSMESTMKITAYGSFLKFDSTNTMEGLGPMSETGFLSYHEKEKFKHVNFADWATTPRIERGDMKGGELVMISDPWDLGEAMGGAVTSRSTITKMSDMQMKLVIEFKNGEMWEKAGEAIYKKANSNYQARM